MGYECYRLPPLGGVRTPDVANEPENLLYSVSGRRLPPAQYRDRLEPYYQKWYDSAPLRWGFEEGTFYPYWELVSSGMFFAVRSTVTSTPSPGDTSCARRTPGISAG